MKTCSVTIDIDCLRSNFKGFGLKNDKYSFREFKIGIQNSLDFFSRFNIRATLFFVAKDLEIKENAALISLVTEKGHEVASHSYSHPQGFRFLSQDNKAAELKRSKEILEDISRQKVVGFRAPGWNISDDTFPLLKELGFKYDSSIFPTSLSILLKALHRIAMGKRDALTRTTLGQIKYMFFPTRPYHTSDLTEFPIQVTRILRLPFFSTFHLKYPTLIEGGYRSIKNENIINYQMHLSDFVDYSGNEFSSEIPDVPGSYIPLSLKLSLNKKMSVWNKVFTAISKDFRYAPLNECLAFL